MKHNLRSLMALASAVFMSTSVFAQTELADPVAPVKPSFPAVESDWVAPVAGESYYIYNTGSGQFLGMGQDWGTRSIVTNANLWKEGDATWSCAANKNTITPYTLEAITDDTEFDGPWFALAHSGTNKANGGAKYLCHEDNAGWADGDTGRRNKEQNGYWRIEEVEGGYLLRPYDVVTLTNEEGTPLTDGSGNEIKAITDKAFGLNAYNMAEKYSFTWTDRAVDATSFVTWKFIAASNTEAVNAILNNEDLKAQYKALLEQYDADMAIYNARVALKATIALAEENGIEDVNVAIEIYNNAEATLGQLQKQDSHLNAEIAGLKYKDIQEFVDATDDNPQDITEYVLINPDFEQDYVQWKSYTEVDGWDITISAANRCLQETAGNVDEEKGYVNILHFLEAWNGSALGDGTISQKIYGLPAGKYVLECDAFTGQGDKTFEGVTIFIESSYGIVETPVQTPDGQPMHFAVTFVNPDPASDFLTFGLKATSTNANWIGCDNFKLTFYGATTVTQAQLDMQAALEKANTFKDNESKYENSYAEARTAFEDAIEAAQNALDEGADDATIAAAQKTMEDAQAAVEASIATYEVLLTYLPTSYQGADGVYGQGKLDYYYNIADECGMGDLAETLENYGDDWQAAYEEGSMSDAEILEKTAGIYPSLKAAWLDVNVEDIKEGADLSWLIENNDFESGKYNAGWDAEDDEVQPGKDYGTIPGWTISSGNITQMNHVIETYHRKFDFNQTINNMPAGVYDITVQGFVRHDGSATDQTIFYAGDSETQLMLRSAQWSLTDLYDPNTQGNPCGGANGDQEIQNSKGETVKVPNGMSGFYFWEMAENTEGADMDYANWQTGDLYYTNHIKVILKQDGDLKIGMKSLSNTDWIIWDNFKMSYLGTAAGLLDDMVAEKFKELQKVYETEDLYRTLEGTTKYEDIQTEMENAKGTLTFEAEAAMEAQIDKIIAYLKAGDAKAKALNEELAIYSEIRIGMVPSSDSNDFNSFVASALATTDILTDDAEKAASNEALAAMEDQMKEGWGKYVMEFAENDAIFSEEYEGEGEEMVKVRTNYGNATEVINNPRYWAYDATAQTAKGWTLELPDSLASKTIGTSQDVAELYNISKFKMYQELKGLTAGYYLLTVDGFYRPGAAADIKTMEDTQKSNVMLFAKSSAQEFSKPLKNIMFAAQKESISESEATVTIGDEKFIIPNMMVAARAYLNIESIYESITAAIELESPFPYASLYRNNLIVKVEEDGLLTIGLNKEELYLPLDWTIFHNWTLTYFGEDESSIPTAVKNIAEKGAKAEIQDIFTIDGRQAKSLQRGINIVRTADGQIQKVMVK